MMMPMLKKLQEIPQTGEVKVGPSAKVLNSILNYSKSLEVKRKKKQTVLIHLN